MYLEGIIKINKYDNICFIGNSMGGYAAILFGTLLNIDNIISFAPQTFIDKFNLFLYFDE
jgi:esterase/lipase